MAGFNKMFVMLPVMLAARKLDGEDPNVVYWLRVAYFSIQAVVLVLVAYTFIQATSVASKPENSAIVYVPPPPQPFADPNAKKKYTETAYGAHVLSVARSLLGSTLFGICLTTGLHWYKGMVMGLAIQTVMAPLNLMENALVKSLLTGTSISPENKIFEEKTASELTANDEVVDAGGNIVVRKPLQKADRSLEEIMLDTWDAGEKADISALMGALNKKNCNTKTKESGWTPLMILAGLGAKGTGSAIRQVLQMGGNPAICDGEGWNAMHWAAFHGSPEAAKALPASLVSVKDKEGKTPLDHAKAEKNPELAKLLEEMAEPKKDK